MLFLLIDAIIDEYRHFKPEGRLSRSVSHITKDNLYLTQIIISLESLISDQDYLPSCTSSGLILQTVLSFFNKYMYRFIPLGIELKRNMDRVIPIYPQKNCA